MQPILFFILRVFSRRILSKYQPEIIGVTGSRGKTSTKEAIATVLRHGERIVWSRKSYNNQLGLPLTVIGCESGGRSAARWLKIFLRALKLCAARDPRYPQILVLEYGADRPGDIRYLTDIAKPKIAVVTGIGEIPVHVEFFEDREAIVSEKADLVRGLLKDDIAVLNEDDPLVRRMRSETKARVMTFGFSDTADVRAIEPRVIQRFEKPIAEGKRRIYSTLRFTMRAFGEEAIAEFLNVVGIHHVSIALAAAAVGLAKGRGLQEIATALREYSAPPGRLQPIPGINDSFLLDDSYNASPEATQAALSTLGALTARRKIAVLGEMRELGRYAEEAHRRIGEKTAGVAEKLFAVGPHASFVLRGARNGGMQEESVQMFADASETIEPLKETIEPGDLILIKGSRRMRMERVVKSLRRHPAERG